MGRPDEEACAGGVFGGARLAHLGGRERWGGGGEGGGGEWGGVREEECGGSGEKGVRIWGVVWSGEVRSQQREEFSRAPACDSEFAEDECWGVGVRSSQDPDFGRSCEGGVQTPERLQARHGEEELSPLLPPSEQMLTDASGTGRVQWGLQALSRPSTLSQFVDLTSPCLQPARLQSRGKAAAGREEECEGR